MEMIAVENSSNINAIGYDPATETLRVRFKNGALYFASSVPAEDHRAFMEAESKGKHFNQHLKQKHKFSPVPEEE